MSTHDNQSQRVSEEEMERTIDDIHEMVNQYGGEGFFDRWYALLDYIRSLQFKEHKHRADRKRAAKNIDLDECNKFFDAVIGELRRLSQKEEECERYREALEEISESEWSREGRCELVSKAERTLSQFKP